MPDPIGASRRGGGNIVADLDGVVYLGDQPVPGVAGALVRLRESGFRVVFATNNSTRSPAEVAARIETIAGLEVDPDAVVTSGMAAASMLEPGDSPVLVVGEDGLRQVLEASGAILTADPESARCVVAGLDRSFAYRDLAAGLAALHGGARFIATNTDITFPAPSGLLPGAGAIAAALQAASGRNPEVAGKPHPPMRAAVERRLGPGPTWIVGDRAETDLALGLAAGWHRVLVLSGITTDPGTVPAEYTPDHVLADASGLASLILGT